MGREAQQNMRKLEKLMNTETVAFNHFLVCPKCGARGRRTAHCDGLATHPACQKEEEHLHRICNVCEYVWTERTLDDPETPKIEKLRANVEIILAMLLEQMGGSVALDMAAVDKVEGRGVYATDVDGKLHVKLSEAKAPEASPVPPEPELAN